ncbi:4-hydroxybenzoate octaprenyltransferase [Salinarimonas sp.]|uniref:4-hydroxybenzoate octaprenyltransferase n=1 Tax=Salinarimonas sp. TaxID=2766526 RepID=UPI00391D853C
MPRRRFSFLAGVDKRLPDAVRGHWADRFVPLAARPFARLARLERPIGWWLLLLPCWWSAALAALHTAGETGAAAYPDPWHLALFLVGAVAMRGAGSTYNDIVDRDLDARVARTRDRPIASGLVSAKAAAAFVALQCLVGLAVLLQFNPFAIATGFASVAIVLAYPFMKRLIWLPQVVLGLCFSWGALMGWAAAFGSLSLAPVLLYLGTIAWVVGYDTIYALQDIEDDEIAGIKSSARLFGARVREAVAACYVLATLLIGGAIALVSPAPLAIVALLAFAAHLAWQVATLDAKDGARALMLFRSNRDAGLILFAGLAVAAAV